MERVSLDLVVEHSWFSLPPPQLIGLSEGLAVHLYLYGRPRMARGFVLAPAVLKNPTAIWSLPVTKFWSITTNSPIRGLAKEATC